MDHQCLFYLQRITDCNWPDNLTIFIDFNCSLSCFLFSVTIEMAASIGIDPCGLMKDKIFSISTALFVHSEELNVLDDFDLYTHNKQVHFYWEWWDILIYINVKIKSNTFKVKLSF